MPGRMRWPWRNVCVTSAPSTALLFLAGERADGAPDLVNILDALQNLAGEIREEDLFLLFFSGHGIEVDGRGYLLTQDSPQAFPEHCSLSLELLRKTLARLEARRRVLFIDACRNTPQAGKGDAGNFMSEAISKDIVTTVRSQASPAATTAMLCACRPGQRAYEWPSRQHGVFTHFLLEGLDGAAWDRQRLDLRNLARYTMHSVRSWCQRTPGIREIQEPWYEEAGDAEGIVLSSIETRQVSAPPLVAPAIRYPNEPVLGSPPPLPTPGPPRLPQAAPIPTQAVPAATTPPRPNPAPPYARTGAPPGIPGQTAPRGDGPPPIIRKPEPLTPIEMWRQDRGFRIFLVVLILAALSLSGRLAGPPFIEDTPRWVLFGCACVLGFLFLRAQSSPSFVAPWALSLARSS